MFLKDDGVKLKVWVTDIDIVIIVTVQEVVDGFVQLLRLTPSRSASDASWTSITMHGQRSLNKTRSVNFLCCDKFIRRACGDSLKIYFTSCCSRQR